VLGWLAAAVVRVLSLALAIIVLGAVMLGWWYFEQSGGNVGPWMPPPSVERRAPAAEPRPPAEDVPPKRPAPKPPSNAGAPLLREASTHVALGQYSEALQTLERARAQGLDLKQPAVAREYYSVLGRLRLERGEFREALPPLREALHRAPTDPGLLLDYGRALEKLNRAEPARAAYRQVLRTTASPDQIAQARAGLNRLR
jgi:tetratricopeptide (TPR) repeat protein